jgi:SAM-dependent methyltransferase
MPEGSVPRPCAVCGGTDLERIHHQSFSTYEGFPLPREYDVVACRACGFVFAATPAAQADYDAYYTRFSKYEDAAVASGTGAGAWEAERFARTADTVLEFVPDPEARILDVGCAGGGFLATLAARGRHRLAGMDHAVGCVEAVRARGFEGYVGGVVSPPPEAAAFAGGFDAVTMLHVLEHVLDVNRALGHAAQWLADGGALYVEVPDAARYHAYDIVPFYFFDCEHINHFSCRSLANLGRAHGLQAVGTGQKDFLASATTRYPAAWCVFRKAAGPDAAVAPEYDGSVRESVRRHLRASVTSGAFAVLDRFAREGAPVIVWGAGSYAQRLLENSALGKCNVRFFVDNDRGKQGGRLGSHPIAAPEAVRGHGDPILICAALFARDIERQIEAMGLSNPRHVIA